MTTNNKFLLTLSVLTFSLSACKTSQDIARERTTYKDPTGVKTVGGPDSETPAVAQLRRDLDVTRGELDNIRFQHQREIEALQGQLRNTELEKEKLTNEVIRLGGQPGTMAIPGALTSSSSQSVPSAPAPSTTGAPTPVAGGNSAANADSAEKLWSLAMSDLKAQKFDAALKLFEDFARIYPKNERHAYSILAQGMIKYRQNRYREAALNFNQIIDAYPKKPLVALAWFGQGAAFGMLNQNEDSKLFFNEVRVRFPKGAEGKLADQIIKRTRKIPADLLLTFPGWAGPFKG